MAKTRRVARRHRRWRQKQAQKAKTKRLREIEQQILGRTSPRLEWEITAPTLDTSVPNIAGDMSGGLDMSVVITGTANDDGTYTLRPSAPGTYRIVSRIR